MPENTQTVAKGPMTCGDVLRKLGTCSSIEHGQWALDELHRLGMAHQSLLADMREQIEALRRVDDWQLALAQADELEEWVERLADIETPVGEDDPGFSLASLAEAMRQLQGERDQALFALAGHEAAAVDRGATFNIEDR